MVIADRKGISIVWAITDFIVHLFEIAQIVVHSICMFIEKPALSLLLVQFKSQEINIYRFLVYFTY